MRGGEGRMEEDGKGEGKERIKDIDRENRMI